MSIDADSLDALISAVGWLMGASMLLVGGTLVAFALWWAQALDEPGLGKLFVRASVAWFGIGITTFGAAAASIGTEAALGYPFGASSGGLVLFAYWLGLRLVTFELAASHGLLRQLERRTASGLHEALAWVTAASGAVAWWVLAAHSFICFVVGLNMAFGG